MPVAAQDEYQTFLDMTATLMMQGAFAELVTFFHHPNRIETLDGVMEFLKPEDTIVAIQEFETYIRSSGGRDFLRVCREARFGNEDRTILIGQHETYILRGSTYVVEPYLNEMTLGWQDGAWRGQHYRALTQNATVPILSPKQLRARALAKEQELKGDRLND